MIEAILNKWQFQLTLRRDYRFNDKTRIIFCFGILKLHKMPPEGVEWDKSKECYKGFFVVKRFKLKQ